MSLAIAELPQKARRTRQLDAAVANLRRGRLETGIASWETFVAGAVKGGAATTDIESVLQWVLRESYLSASKELADRANKVKFFNDQKKALREELDSGRRDLRTVASWPIRRRVLTPRRVYVARGSPIERTEMRRFDRAGFETYLESLEDFLQSVGDDAQLANIDLQNALQKQQQTLQTISAVSKRLHDTAMAVIRKIG